MEQCVLTIGTVTQTIRARKLLAGLHIASRMIKRTGTAQKSGCAYGLEIQSADLRRATRILQESGIAFEWSGEAGGR